MEFDNIDTDKLFKYVNLELSKDKKLSVNKLCDKIGIKRSTLKSRARRENYSFDINIRQYIKNNITSNITKETEKTSKVSDGNITNNKAPIVKESVTSNITIPKEIDYNKLNLLLDNLDSLLKLVDTSNITNNTTCSITIESNETSVKSLRINNEVYKKIKDKAKKEDVSISSIVNRALIDYLNNYI